MNRKLVTNFKPRVTLDTSRSIKAKIARFLLAGGSGTKEFIKHCVAARAMTTVETALRDLKSEKYHAPAPRLDIERAGNVFYLAHRRTTTRR